MTRLAVALGAVLGLLLGRHPLAAALGAGLGWLLAAVVLPRLLGAGSASPVPALFMVLGRIAKVDGRVDASEIAVCERLMERLALDAQGRADAVAAFNAGKQDEAVLDRAWVDLRRARAHAPLFIEVFIDMALADGVLAPEERRLLGKCAWMLGVRETTLELMLHRRRAGGRAGQTPADAAADDPYAVLGLDHRASDAEVRRAYRSLVSRHHPDRMTARGEAPETVRLAQARTQEILAAYERIRSARGMR
ncbi:MAG: TerB family tellurite resistance protein [Xanthomonadales bacterium]|nr:TerB family tellurite resistance protein [Xanthomonadales bacterium]